MPRCAGCGGFVTTQYVKVFAPEEHEQNREVRVCPDCPDRVRDGTEVRQARSPRQ